MALLLELEFDTATPLLAVFDMDRSLAFYRDVLGFSVVEQAGPADDVGWVWLRRGDFHLMLNTAYERPDRPAAPDPARVAAHADVALYIGCADADAVYAALRARGVELAPPAVAPYGMKQLYLRDPDGFVLCFQHPVAAHR
jgi:catechol 2,3-dioxygenase-like lactoylglutathione lyase family enzyme